VFVCYPEENETPLHKLDGLPPVVVLLLLLLLLLDVMKIKFTEAFSIFKATKVCKVSVLICLAGCRHEERG